jgi:membrane-anchored protein YejM (alkaline phosphatase superfamily)
MLRKIRIAQSALAELYVLHSKLGSVLFKTFNLLYLCNGFIQHWIWDSPFNVKGISVLKSKKKIDMSTV